MSLSTLTQCLIHFFNGIEKMYQTSECCVKVDKLMTESFKNNIGVKQGEVLHENCIVFLNTFIIF